MDDANKTHADAAKGPAPYRVLARKYRPQTFADLIGQDAMVRTLTNAFETGRIAQAYMLTGVRGVGKTTTARIIARALNYSLPGRIDQPTIDMREFGEHCAAIMESRHVDVIEMDAASHTGIGDIREIIESVRYRPVSARTKVYIIDEVHMLSTAAFNGLLKTLEEPPEHVKFIFATTEIRKVPITVLSRCQRFDLRRVDAGLLVQHLKKIADLEKVTGEDEALALIARAAEGSVRDALSILDQAIAHSGGGITAEAVRAMLGLADRSRIIDLFATVMAGDVAAALAELRAQYDTGADPAIILSDLAGFVHLVTRLKYVPEAARDPSLAEAERRQGTDFAARLDMRTLGRAWQMLLKGIQETQGAPRPLAAAEMVLVRLAHAAGLPTPDELIRVLQAGGGHAVAASQASETGPGAAAREVSSGEPRPAPRGHGQQAALQTVPLPQAAGPVEDGVVLSSFEDVVNLAGERRAITLKLALQEKVRLVRFEQGRIEIGIEDGAPANLAHDLSRQLNDWTGRRWMVIVSGEKGEAPLAIQAETRRAAMVREAAAAQSVRRLLDAFPGAEIVEVRENPIDALPSAEEADDGDDGD